MGKGIKIALPGYDAQTDTNPDHFALYVDQDEAVDYILIKEYAKGVTVVNASSSKNIVHNLGYVPLCLVYAEISSGVWRKLFSKSIDSLGPYFTIDDTNLTLVNDLGSSMQFAYHVFLDNVTDGNPSIASVGKHLGFVVAKRGYNAETDTNPNHFIFHSDYNTFKIIAEATKNVTLAAATNNQSFTEAHNQSFVPLVAGFAKESSKSQVFLPNADNIDTYGVKAGWSGTGVRFNYISADANNVIFNFDNTTGSSVSVSIRYFVLEKVG